MELINLTPHKVVLLKGEDKIIYPASGEVARVSVAEEETDNEMFVLQKFGEVVGIPAPQKGILYIVSQIVFSNSKRKDLVVPNTAKAVRDDQGNIIGVPNFITRK